MTEGVATVVQEVDEDAPKPVRISEKMLRELRLARNESQSRFWGRFGVTQTRGSRFELGQEIPLPVGILIRLYFDGVISDGDLWRARRRYRIAGKARSQVSAPAELTASR